MTEYTLSDFLGIFLVFIPAYAYLTLVLQKGIYGMIEEFFDTDSNEKKNFFHHHFHYKAK
jgi:predicted CDP-diglyceride synthetase/phosphatidate cytidylyltransferase